MRCIETDPRIVRYRIESAPPRQDEIDHEHQNRALRWATGSRRRRGERRGTTEVIMTPPGTDDRHGCLAREASAASDGTSTRGSLETPDGEPSRHDASTWFESARSIRRLRPALPAYLAGGRQAGTGRT